MDKVAVGIFEVEPFRARAGTVQVIPYFADFNAFATQFFMGRSNIRRRELQRHCAELRILVIARESYRNAAFRKRERDPPAIIALAIVRHDFQTELLRIKLLRLRHITHDYREHH